MVSVFTKILSMSATASFVILAVLLARLLLKRAPKIISYALWGVVLIRLLCPVSFSSPFYGVPQVESSPVEFAVKDVQAFAGEGVTANAAAVPANTQAAGAAAEKPMEILSILWLVGIGCMVLYALVSYLRLRKKLVGAVPYQGNIYQADYLQTPFVMGFIHPKIYLPSTLTQKELPYILAHEQHHIKRLDHIIKPIGFFALCVHWFNPLVWVAFLLFCKDMEMSCDEAVIQKLGAEVRRDYSASLLSFATGHKIIGGTPLTFGEGDTKGRIKNLKAWKKPTVWVLLIAAAACVLLAVVLLTNRAQDEEKPLPQQSTAASDTEGNQPVPVELTKETANACITQVLESLRIEEEGTVSFAVPESLPVNDENIELAITLNARYSPEPGTTRTQTLLDNETGWKAGQSYTGTLDLQGEKLTSLMLFAAFVQPGEPSGGTHYAADYVELTEPFQYGQPITLAKETISATQEGQQVTLSMTFKTDPAAQVTFTLPEGIFLVSAKDVLSGEEAQTEEGSQLLFVKNEKDVVGDLSLTELAATQTDLQGLDTSEEKLPMQVFAGVALSNHVDYANYAVHTHTDTGAGATALFCWQDLSQMDEYGAAAGIPYNEQNAVLFYDWAKMPCFIQMNFDPEVVSQEECAAIAKSMAVTAQ